MNIQKLMKQAQKMQQEMSQMQEQLAQKHYSGSAGGEAVQLVLNGEYRLQKISIDPELAQEDLEMLQDLLVVAFNSAVDQIKKDLEDQMGSLSGGMPGGVLPGF